MKKSEYLVLKKKMQVKLAEYFLSAKENFNKFGNFKQIYPKV